MAYQGPGPSGNRRQWVDEMKSRMPWLPRELIKLWAASWVELEDGEMAWNEVRQTSNYDKYFAGNKRDDGTVRLDEAEYHSRIEFFDDTIRSVGLNARAFRELYPTLIEGNVDPNEFYRRVDAITERIMLGMPEMVQWYKEQGYLDAFPEMGMRQALLASALSPELGEQLLDRRITMAEIAGEGEARGFRIREQFASKLAKAGIGRDEAQQFFGEVSNLMPALNVLARRHGDPDDDFDLNEFRQALIMDDPFERRRMMRLVAQERGEFSQSGGLGVGQSDSGRFVGLERR